MRRERRIVGRCADYVLKDEKSLLRCFIYASEDSRTERAIREQGAADKAEAKKLLHQMDRKRGQHYNAFTNRTWGARGNYDLMLDSSVFGIDGCCNLIIEGLKQRNIFIVE